jgi:hypothetical protein
MGQRKQTRPGRPIDREAGLRITGWAGRATLVSWRPRRRRGTNRTERPLFLSRNEPGSRSTALAQAVDHRRAGPVSGNVQVCWRERSPGWRASTARAGPRGQGAAIAGLDRSQSAGRAEGDGRSRLHRLAAGRGLAPARRQRPAVLSTTRGFTPRLRERAGTHRRVLLIALLGVGAGRRFPSACRADLSTSCPRRRQSPAGRRRTGRPGWRRATRPAVWRVLCLGQPGLMADAAISISAGRALPGQPDARRAVGANSPGQLRVPGLVRRAWWLSWGPTAMRIASPPVSGIHLGPFLRTQRRRHGITPGAAADAMPGRWPGRGVTAGGGERASRRAREKRASA